MQLLLDSAENLSMDAATSISHDADAKTHAKIQEASPRKPGRPPKKQKAERLANAELIFAFAQLRGKLPKNCLQGAWKSMFFIKILKNDTLQKL